MKHYTSLSDLELLHLFRKVKTKKKRFSNHFFVEYLNTAITFDTETTSYISDGEKVAYCYIWQVCVEGVAFYGRTLDEFHSFCEKIQRVLNLSDTRRLLCYVHNLDFDFQFIRKYFTWTNVFARSERKPIYALCDLGIEFRCSYMLTLLPLAKLPDQMPEYKREKMVGDLDYTLPRHSETPLTEKEMRYCEMDVLVLYDYIQYEISQNKNNVVKIPLTKTGYVRRECRNALQKNKNFWGQYKKRIDDAFPTPEIFTLLFKAYQGGYTHANSRFVNLALTGVESWDFDSSYPAVMVCKNFPWKFHKIEIQSKEMFERFIQKYACLFEISFEGIKATTTTTIISTSKCEYLKNPIVDNGRLLCADEILTYLTDLDFQSIKEYYTWDTMTIGLFYYAKYEPLPTPFVDVVLKAYKAKCELKGVDGKEQEYQVAKGIINGIYGMCVTNPVCDTIHYEGNEWSHTKPDLATALDEQIENAFLLYQWGVWVSAHARRNLLKIVRQVEENVVYNDTDSCKLLKDKKTDKIVHDYNAEQIKVFEDIAKQHDYEIPTLPSGKKSYLGVFDYEGVYDLFKTLGAKRYVYEQDGKFGVTIAGLPKKRGAEYIQSRGGFSFFTDGMTIPPDESGKKEHTYIDETKIFTMVDYKGISKKCVSLSGVHLANTGFTLSLTEDYIALFEQQQKTILGLEVGKETLPDLAIGARRFLKEINGGFK